MRPSTNMWTFSMCQLLLLLCCCFYNPSCVGFSLPSLRSTKKSFLFTASSTISNPPVEKNTADKVPASKQPQAHYDSIIAGGGPAGLMAAIMLSQKYGPEHKIAVCERRPGRPASPSDDTVWSDIARFYLLGIGHRGQSCFEKFGVMDDFIKASVQVNGRRDWAPGKTKVEEGRITPARKTVASRVLPRDKLVGVLYHHLVENYVSETNNTTNIDLLYGYEVDPISFGNDKDSEDFVTVRISKCADLAPNEDDDNDDEETCDVDSYELATAKLLIGADGSARTVANAMERIDAERVQNLNPLVRPFSKKPFQVTRFVDDNPRVYKSVPIRLPADWPCDLNYSARSSDSRITLEALPSDDKGNLCALLLMKPDDELAQGNVEASKLRAFFDKEFPQFGALIGDEEMARVATKSASALPAFRYAGPRLNMGSRTLILGDAAHTVKPYYGLGANSALEDVQMLSDALDDASKSTKDGDRDSIIPSAVNLFSDRRSGDAEALVTISRNMDRPGKLFFFTFILPLILDGIFHKLAPKIFGPNMFGMFQLQGVGFKQIQRKKRFDRALQMTCLGTMFAGMAWSVKTMLSVLARVSGKSQGVVSTITASTLALAVFLRKATASKTATAETD